MTLLAFALLVVIKIYASTRTLLGEKIPFSAYGDVEPTASFKSALDIKESIGLQVYSLILKCMRL